MVSWILSHGLPVPTLGSRVMFRPQSIAAFILWIFPISGCIGHDALVRALPEEDVGVPDASVPADGEPTPGRDSGDRELDGSALADADRPHDAGQSTDTGPQDAGPIPPRA